MKHRILSASGHMPFEGHRTQKQVREDEEHRLYGPLPDWCPDTYRDQYYHLQRKCRFSHDEARRLIWSQIEADTRRAANG